MSPLAKGRLKLLLVTLVFVAPLAAAVAIYVVPSWRPDARINHGTLVEPVRAVPALALADATGGAAALRGKWSLVYVGGDACHESCRARLLMTRQVRLALNQNRDRVQRVYVAPTAAALAPARAELGEAHPDLVWLIDNGSAGTRAADFFRPAEPDADALYLVDPLGNWLMVYAGDVQAKGLHRDLKKLLRFSTVG